ncbi:vegetative incompatibility protein HET-E-1 [Elaphomyces granulatus]
MLSPEDYIVGWVCALPLEMTAAKAILDETHSNLSQPATDHNTYTLGKISGHNVVITCLPSGVYGTTPAAVVVSQMSYTFPRIQFGLMVGIGGGVPCNGTDIRFGDVVVSKPAGSYSGVVQYDRGKVTSGGRLKLSGTLNQPPQVLLTSIAQLQADQMSGKNHSIATMLSGRQGQIHDRKAIFACPGREQDQLFRPTYDHMESEDNTCVKCDKQQLVHREQRATKEPEIHYGLIASGNQVMKDGQTRDNLVQEHGILCFEMEAAGLMNQLPCLVIRGICDYSDSHKNKKWQGYAALTAAAYGKMLLSVVPVASTPNRERVRTEMTDKEKECLRHLFLTDPADDKNALKRRKGERAPGTCEWILETEELEKWLGPTTNTECNENMLWLYGNPGTGKSTMAIAMTEELSNQSPFDSYPILRGLLYQLINQHQELMKFLLSRYEVREEQKAKLFTSFDALWATLIEIGHDTASGEKYCIIDALDECDRESQHILLTQIYQTFSKHNSKNSHPRIHILITSRPYPEIAQHLTGFNRKDLASYQNIKMDLQVFIEEKVKELSQKKNYSEKVTLEVSRILEEKAEGTFMWVGIACGELTNVRCRDAVKKLRNLPRGLHSLYQELLDTALESGDEDNQTIIQMLSFVAVSRRPLSVAELSEACQLYHDEDEESRLRFTQEDIEMCRLMIIVQDGIVRLLHKSVRDYLCRSVKLMRNWKQENVFLEYAVLYWPDHAAFAQTEFFVIREHESFFQLESSEREKWRRMYNSTACFSSRTPKGFSIFHVAARWGISCLVHFGLTNMTTITEPGNSCASSKEFDNADFKAQSGVTPLEEAVRAGQIDMTAIFLEKIMPGMVMDLEVPLAAASTNKNAKEMMALLLDRRGDQIQITEDVIKAAASNWRSGEEVMALLLDRRGDQIQITEDVVRAAVGNWGNGVEVMALLLDRQGDQIQITEDVVTAAVRNDGNGGEVMALLLDRRELMALLLDRRGDQIQITGDIVNAAASNKLDGKRVMALLLDRRGDQIQITEDIVKTAASNRLNGKEMITLLLDRRGDQIQITEDVVKAAASNWVDGEEVMALLLNRRGDQIQITEDVVKAAASNRLNGKEVMALLLDRRGDQIQITEEVVKAAASNEKKGTEVMALLLDRCGDQIHKP